MTATDGRSTPYEQMVAELDGLISFLSVKQPGERLGVPPRLVQRLLQHLGILSNKLEDDQLPVKDKAWAVISLMRSCFRLLGDDPSVEPDNPVGERMVVIHRLGERVWEDACIRGS